MKKTADVIIVGSSGAHGSAALYQAALMGGGVIGIDQHPPGHRHGSSHGQSRITRLATAEGTEFTWLARRSLDNWKALEEKLDLHRKLYLPNGALMIGQQKNTTSFHGKQDFVKRTVRVATKNDVPHLIYSADDLREKYPLFKVQDDEYAYFEPTGGVLFPEACIAANHRAAVEYGATIYTDTTVNEIEDANGTVIVRTSAGDMHAKKCIVAVGPYIHNFLPRKYHKYFNVTRQVMFWFKPNSSEFMFRPEHFPVFIWERHGIYGFPDLGTGMMKVASGDKGFEVPMKSARQPDPFLLKGEMENMHRTLLDCIPAAAGSSWTYDTCLYTNTPDDGFVIDRHPDMYNVTLVSACSGHAFKHSAAIGEIAARIALNNWGNDDPDLSEFNLTRFR